MQKSRVLETLAGFAAVAALLVPAWPAQARPLLLHSRSDVHVVSATMQTPVYFRAMPDARCLISAGSPRALAVYANDDGIGRFFLTLGAGAAPNARFVAACDEGNIHVMLALAISAVRGSVNVPRPRPVIDRNFSEPHGFNPVTASADDLDRYGYPPRPDISAGAQAYADWYRAVTAPTVRVASTRVLRPDRTQSLVHIDGTSTSSNWSGTVAKGATGQFTKVVGKWSVPSVFTDQSHSPAYSSLWVGLDGYTSSKDIIQNGTESDAVYDDGYVVSDYYAWFEYYPDEATEEPDFDVTPGDEVYMSSKKCTYGSHSMTGCFYFVNFTQNERTDAKEWPDNAKFVGNNAEWILERPTVNGNLHYLPDYGTAETTDMLTYDTHQAKFVAAGNESFDNVNMVHNGDLMSKSTYLSKTTTGFTWYHYH